MLWCNGSIAQSALVRCDAFDGKDRMKLLIGFRWILVVILLLAVAQPTAAYAQAAEAAVGTVIVLELPAAALALLILAIIAVVVIIIISFISLIRSTPPPPPRPTPQPCQMWKLIKAVGDKLTYVFEGVEITISWSGLQAKGAVRIPDYIHPK